MKTSLSIKKSKEVLEQMKVHYQDYLIENNGEYVFFSACKDGVIITGYDSKKENKKITFVGEGAIEEARLWANEEELILPKEKEILQEKWLCLDSQIGSDEVGVGDFLLPMIVVAAYVNERDISLLEKIGVHDSKKLTDKKIMEIGPSLVERFKYSKLTLSNEKYNEMILKNENLNSLKAKMHNRVLKNLHNDYPEVVNIFVDEFVNEDKYYKYLNDENEEQVKGVTFRTKGETYYPCVALASIIARYAFLNEKKKLEDHYQMSFPFGASKAADTFAQEFIKKYGVNEFDKIAKKNFKNYKTSLKEELI